MKGIGTDAAELPRIARLVEEKPEFIARILTSEETKLFQSLPFRRQIESLGGRYVCGKAFSKAWRVRIGKVTLQDVEILKNENGQPVATRSSHEDNVQADTAHTNETALT